MILVNTKTEDEFNIVLKLIGSTKTPRPTAWLTNEKDTVLFLYDIETDPDWFYGDVEYAQENYPTESIITFHELLEQYYPEELTLPKTELVSDPIYKPSHYQLEDGTQVKDHITSLTAHMSGVRAWATGNAIKYLARAGRKDDMVKDLKKAQENIQIIIDNIEKENN